MKKLSLRLVILLFPLILVHYFAIGQYTVISSNAPVSIVHEKKAKKLYTPALIINLPLVLNDELQADYGYASLRIKTPKGSGSFYIIDKDAYKLKDILESSAFKLDPSNDPFIYLAFKWFKDFMRNDEDKESYKKRRLREIGGNRLASLDHPLDFSTLKTELGVRDEQDLAFFKDSLIGKNITDPVSTNLYLGHFFEQRGYLQYASENFKMAYNVNTKSSDSSRAVKAIYQQFLIRYGHKDDAKSMNFGVVR